MLRAIREIRPSFVVGENVYGLVNWNGGLVFDEVQSDLENEGYEVQPVILPACSKNAPHKRDRVWFVAYSNGSEQTNNEGTNTKEEGKIRRHEKSNVSGKLSSVRTTTNPNDTGSGKRLRTNGNREKKNEGRKGQPQSKSGENVKNGNVTDTESSSIKRELQQQQKEGKSGGQNSGDNATNTTSSGRIQDNEQQQSRKPEHARTSWEQFPTQSPICSRNDGISDRLDGITFPKWRSESIKGYGNAIVPNVAFEIFKALEQTK